MGKTKKYTLVKSNISLLFFVSQNQNQNLKNHEKS